MIVTTSKAKTLECRMVPMMVLPGKLQGTMDIMTPSCSAEKCMHWAEASSGSKLSDPPVDATGFCALDAYIKEPT